MRLRLRVLHWREMVIRMDLQIQFDTMHAPRNDNGRKHNL